MTRKRLSRLYVTLANIFRVLVCAEWLCAAALNDLRLCAADSALAGAADHVVSLGITDRLAEFVAGDHIPEHQRTATWVICVS